jgi:hypothetical protein
MFFQLHCTFFMRDDFNGGMNTAVANLMIACLR